MKISSSLFVLAITSLIAVQAVANPDPRDPPSSRPPRGGDTRPAPLPNPNPPVPNPPVYYPPVTGSYSVQAVVESSFPMNLYGNSLYDIESSCLGLLSAYSGSIDEMYVNGTRFYQGSGYWTKSNVCAILALNAAGSAYPSAQVSVESVSFLVEQRPDNLGTSMLRDLLPRALGSTSIDDISVNGVSYYKSSGYWNVNQTVSLIANVLYTPTPYDYMEASGSIEGVLPFRLFGAYPQDIQSKCFALMAEFQSSLGSIDDVTVNGQRFYKSVGYYNNAELCSILSNSARYR